ncbi:MAG: aminomethyl-transferring glycine dehydrogenase subunit GcvPA, partial [Leptospiraceae bacterium]|nr:aminomethyl-transferring glycine dehydrogenase subunit GcvPA [Leptospiraceae bacterium]
MTQTILTELSKEEIEENSYFLQRHVGSGPAEIQEMLHLLGYSNIQEFIKKTVPEEILLDSELQLPLPLSEYETLKRLKSIVSQNKLFRSFIGAGYYNTILPPVIQRNILENPGWYTAYTPYQAEISQGRLEALLNFQTMICELTGMEISNASLLDEGTAAAEAMSMCFGLKKKENGNTIFVADNCHPQTIDVMLTRAEPFDIDLEISNLGSFKPSKKYFAILIQYPGTDGKVEDFEALSRSCKENGILFIVAADILSLALLKPPAEFGADVAIGSTQRFGVPMGFGGPHAAYMATHDTYKRSMPGRLIGVSKDRQGKKALRLALQTREQHIRRDKATSNICTAQVLLAVMAAMYASYHGPKGIKQIAESIHFKTRFLAGVLKENGYSLQHENFFDTLFFPVNGEKKE